MKTLTPNTNTPCLGILGWLLGHSLNKINQEVIGPPVEPRPLPEGFDLDMHMRRLRDAADSDTTFRMNEALQYAIGGGVESTQGVDALYCVRCAQIFKVPTDTPAPAEPPSAVLEIALEALEANDKWHIDTDEHGGYEDSQIQGLTHGAIQIVKSEIKRQG